MERDIKQEVITDLRAASTLINQAQERLHPSLGLFKALGIEYDDLEELIDSIEAGDFDKKEPKVLKRDEIIFNDPNHIRFIEDMEAAGHEIHFYRGRNFYQGPSVYVDSLQKALSETRIACGWDSLGKGYVVHPEVSDSTLSNS